jgi:ABC-type multidrug transport system permease subunit
LRKHQRDLVIDPISATYWVNPESSASRFAERLLVSGVLAGGGQGGWEMQAAAGSPIRYVDWLLPGLVGMNLMFSALFGVGFVIVRYRKNGVLKRLQVTPTHPFEFLLAQVASRVLVILGTALLILYGGAFLTGAQNKGALLDIVVLLVCGSLAMISIGVLVASRTGSEELAGGLVQVVSWPMMLFSGIWFSIDELHPWFIRAADLFPLTHLLRALRAIWLDGSGLVQADGVVIRSALILLAFAVVFLLAGASMFRWNDDS